MKVRVKFKKTGMMKFIGHLDVMRYFQKANRRAGIDIGYSGGFSPHQLLSFASPLGLGLTSEGEYLDMELNSFEGSEAMRARLNGCMTEGMEIVSCRLLPDEAKTAMSIVAAADYLVFPRKGEEWDGWQEDLEGFLDQGSILIVKKTKKSEKETDIRPLVYQWERRDPGTFLKLACGSAENLKPELLLEAFYEKMGREWSPYRFHIHRLELYAAEGESGWISLEEMGKEQP